MKLPRKQTTIVLFRPSTAPLPVKEWRRGELAVELTRYDVARRRFWQFLPFKVMFVLGVIYFTLRCFHVL